MVASPLFDEILILSETRNTTDCITAKGKDAKTELLSQVLASSRYYTHPEWAISEVIKLFDQYQNFGMSAKKYRETLIGLNEGPLAAGQNGNVSVGLAMIIKSNFSKSKSVF